jgi:hypothetical protein
LSQRLLPAVAARPAARRFNLNPGPSRWQDLRYALRLLVRTPLFTLLTVAVLGGGLGLSVFTFSFLHTDPQADPVADGNRVVRVLGTVDGATANSLDAADVAVKRHALRVLGARRFD